MRRLGVGVWVALALLAQGCAADADGDGFPATVDCDDGDDGVYPGATELCDGVDRNCDGQGDLGAADGDLLYGDADGDGFGDPATAAWTCPAAGLVDQSGDCDDGDGLVFPGALTLFVDRDGDGFGDDATPVVACGEPMGTSVVGGDCDDGQDGVFPGAVEICNEQDDDCDADIDEGAADALLWFVDADADGFGENGVPVEACSLVGGALQSGDCDDGDDTVFPAAPETCDGVDDDCDGLTDEDAVDASTWYPDIDGDGYGWAGAPTLACAQPADFVADGTDCNDAAADDFPGAVERCDARDNDCDGTVDGPSAIDRTWWYADLDGDGFGEDGSGVLACDPPVDHVGLPYDCDDGDDTIRPLVAEVCDDGVDNDCSGVIDDCGGGGTPVTPWPSSSEDADVVLTSAPYSSAGTSLAAVDLDGDTFPEIVAGGPSRDSSDGWVWLFDGVPSSGDIDLQADSIIVGVSQEGEKLGFTVENLGDLDDDGYDELGVGAPGWNANGGAHYIWYGGPSLPPSTDSDGADAWMRGPQNRALGWGLGGLGDWDGDGYDDAGFADLAYESNGAYSNGEGGIHLVYGGASRVSGAIDRLSLPTLVGNPDDQLCADDCLASGDIDGDGVDDIVVHGDGLDLEARVYFLYGDPARVTGVEQITNRPALQVTGADSWFGNPTVIPGDLDGDGYPDVVIGDGTYDQVTQNGGAFWVVPGGSSRLTGTSAFGAVWSSRVTCLESQALLGQSIAGVGDLDSDGTDDLAVGAPAADGLQPNSGVVALFAGLPAGESRLADATHLIEGAIGNDSFGRTLLHGDFDGDGAGDLIVGTGAESHAGKHYFLLGGF